MVVFTVIGVATVVLLLIAFGGEILSLIAGLFHVD